MNDMARYLSENVDLNSIKHTLSVGAPTVAAGLLALTAQNMGNKDITNSNKDMRTITGGSGSIDPEFNASIGDVHDTSMLPGLIGLSLGALAGTALKKGHNHLSNVAGQRQLSVAGELADVDRLNSLSAYFGIPLLGYSIGSKAFGEKEPTQEQIDAVRTEIIQRSPNATHDDVNRLAEIYFKNGVLPKQSEAFQKEAILGAISGTVAKFAPKIMGAAKVVSVKAAPKVTAIKQKIDPVIQTATPKIKSFGNDLMGTNYKKTQDVLSKMDPTEDGFSELQDFSGLLKKDMNKARVMTAVPATIGMTGIYNANKNNKKKNEFEVD